jgi:hypothetical protein
MRMKVSAAPLNVHDVLEYANSIIGEFEQIAGHPITVGELVDVLNDFGKFPEGITPEETGKLIRKIAREYVGWSR